MRTLSVILILIITGCATSSPENFYTEFEGQDEVIIVLDHYGLETLPEGITTLSEAISLRVYSNNVADLWRVYPPLSAYHRQEMDFKPPFHQLPDSITELQNLQELEISELNLHTLPENFGQLKNLKRLNISFNKLNISDELPKLKSLPRLQEVFLFGNQIDTLELNTWKVENPDLVINY